MSSGTPYIGSKISLVSKAEIRYEGFLYTIDQNDSTVTLAKVISLGTEDRVPGAGAVPAREEVFEYIVFRGSDIKDLHVCEGPKKVEDPAIVTHSYSQSYNPNYHRGPPSFPPQGGPGLNFGYNPFNIPQQNNVPVDLSQHPNSRQQTPPNIPRGEQRGSGSNKNAGSSNFQDNRNKMKGNEGGGGSSGKYRDDGYAREHRESTGSKQGKDKELRRESQEGGNRDGTRDERGTRDNRSYRDNRDNRTRGGRTDRGDHERRDNQKSNRGDDSDDKDSGKNLRDNRYRENRREIRDNRYNRGDNRDSNRESRYKRDNREQEDRDEQRSTGTEGNRGQTRGGRGVGRGRGGGNRRGGGPRGGNSGGVAPATRNKFTEDFDFETSNAKFNKEEIEKELLKVLKKVKIKDEDGTEEIKDIEGERESDERAPLPSPDKFYDRSKSFFDNILCEAMPPRNEEEVMTRRQEQALNTETFGSSAAHYRPAYRGRGRGRGRWRGGRGFRGGRGNFRGNSNRRWVDYEFDYEAAGIKSKNQPKVSED